MANEVRLPKLGKAMKQATIVNLKVGLNHSVAKGEILCDLETDKATLEFESPYSGKIRHIFCREGQTLSIDSPLFIVSTENETIDPDLLSKLQNDFTALLNSTDSRPSENNLNNPAGAADPASNTEELLSKIRPAVNSIGAIREFAGQTSSPVEIQPGQKIPLTRWQKIIADKMILSKQQIPCFYLNIRVDATEMSELRDKLNKTAETKYSFNDFIMAALARGIKQYPIMSGQLGHDCIVLPASIDVSFAVAVDNGLVAPAVRDIAKKTLEQINTACCDLIVKAKEKKLTADDIAGGCITISNLGSMGIDSFIPIAVPGQCSILGVGRIIDTPTPSGKGDILVRKIMNLNLSVDHRIANGADAAQFLDFVKKQLEHPDELLDKMS